MQFDFFGFPPPTPGPSAPTNLIGFQRQNDFGVIFELFNTLQWQPSDSLDVQGYYIYRNNVHIATVNSSTTSYQDHNQPFGVATLYGVAAFDEDGNVSDQITITIG